MLNIFRAGVYVFKKIVADSSAIYTTPLEVSKEEISELHKKLPPKIRAKQESPIQMQIFLTGLISVFIPVLGLIPWLIGRKEMKTYPNDLVVKAGNLLGRSVVILWIVVIITGLLLLPIILSGAIKI